MSANLDIELLRTFHAILRFGRFLAAASHLNRSPSAVSTHVRRLEELAGGRLFERDNQSVRLTPLGQRFQRQTAELLETHDRVLAGLRRREEPLRVRFGISEEYAGKRAPRSGQRTDEPSDCLTEPLHGALACLRDSTLGSATAVADGRPIASLSWLWTTAQTKWQWQWKPCSNPT